MNADAHPSEGPSMIGTLALAFVVGVVAFCGFTAVAIWMVMQNDSVRAAPVTGRTSDDDSRNQSADKTAGSVTAKIATTASNKPSKAKRDRPAPAAADRATVPDEQHDANATESPQTTLAQGRATRPSAPSTLRAPDTVLPQAVALFQKARQRLERGEFALAAVEFERVTAMLGSRGDLDADLHRSAAEFAAISREEAAEDRARVFTDADANVRQPVILSSALPARPDLDTPASDLDTLELMIDTDGSVEQARLISRKGLYRNRWWVSAAKTWRFKPAMKGGQAVKFMTRIPIADGAQP